MLIGWGYSCLNSQLVWAAQYWTSQCSCLIHEIVGFFYFTCVLLSAYMYVHHMHAVLLEARRVLCIPWSWRALVESQNPHRVMVC